MLWEKTLLTGGICADRRLIIHPCLSSPWSLGLLLPLVIASSTSVDRIHLFTGSSLVPGGFLHSFIHKLTGCPSSLAAHRASSRVLYPLSSNTFSPFRDFLPSGFYFCTGFSHLYTYLRL
jgi:hypothetical protein